jgi:LuxR family maltose regulon positive regulatory protein
MQGNLRAAVECGRGMLQVLPAGNHIGRARGLSLVAMAELRAGDVLPADADFEEAAREARYSAVPTVGVPFLCSQAESRLLQGKLQQAYDLNEQGLALAQAGDHELPLAGFAHVGLAKVLYERNDLAVAAARARTGIQLLGQGGIAEAFGNGHGVLALIRQAMGDDTGALGDAEQGVRLAVASGLPRNISEAWTYRARIWLAQGHVAPAASWIDEMAHLPRGENLAEFEELTAARVLLAQREVSKALALLERLQAAAAHAGRSGRALEAKVLRSLALSACGDRSAAFALLEAALAAAEPQGYVRVFLDAGPGILPLLEQLTASLGYATYAGRVLAAHAGAPEPPGPHPPQPQPLRPATMPSEREMQVLKLLASELSVPEIAERLVIAPSTVRSHVKHLYEILDAHSRFEAVGRARELDLI